MYINTYKKQMYISIYIVYFVYFANSIRHLNSIRQFSSNRRFNLLRQSNRVTRSSPHQAERSAKDGSSERL